MKLHAFSDDGSVRHRFDIDEAMLEAAIRDLGRLRNWREVSSRPTMTPEFLLIQVEHTIGWTLGLLSQIEGYR